MDIKPYFSQAVAGIFQPGVTEVLRTCGGTCCLPCRVELTGFSGRSTDFHRVKRCRIPDVSAIHDDTKVTRSCVVRSGGAWGCCRSATSDSQWH